MFGHRHRRTIGIELGAGAVRFHGTDNRSSGRNAPTAANEGTDPYYLAGPLVDNLNRTTVRVHAIGVIPQ